MFVGRVAISIVSLFLASCAALNHIHDPQSGLIDRDQVPKLLQSVRCELVTFIDVNNARMANYGKADTLPFFPLDPNQISAVFLDLKVIDTLSLPSGSSGNNVNYKPAEITWHLGPTASDTNTYELNWPFVISQKATLNLMDPGGRRTTAPIGNPYFPCYHPTNVSKEQLARNEFPELATFSRIYVDAKEPFAAWLLYSSAQVGTALFTGPTANQTERMVPAQMIYTFTVQAGFGGDASYSLATKIWNPLSFDIAGSTQQTSTLTLYINGYDSLNANGAKSGLISTVALDRPYALGEKPCPPNLCIQDAHPKYPLSINPPQPQ